MPDPDDDDLDDDETADDTQTELDIRYRLDEPDPPGMADTGNESDDSFFTDGKEDPMTPPPDPTPTTEQRSDALYKRLYAAWNAPGPADVWLRALADLFAEIMDASKPPPTSAATSPATPAPAAPGGGEAKYGEPWSVAGPEDGDFIQASEGEGDIVCDAPDLPASRAEWLARRDRIIACVNAMAGIADPAAFVAAARLRSAPASPPDPTRGETPAPPPTASEGCDDRFCCLAKGHEGQHKNRSGWQYSAKAAPPPEPKPASDPLEAEDIACIRTNRSDARVVLMCDDDWTGSPRRWPWASYRTSGPEAIAEARRDAESEIASRRPRLYQRADSEWKSVPLVEPASPPPVEGKATPSEAQVRVMLHEAAHAMLARINRRATLGEIINVAEYIGSIAAARVTPSQEGRE